MDKEIDNNLITRFQGLLDPNGTQKKYIEITQNKM